MSHIIPHWVAFVSCVSSTLFQPARSGSHLYPAHRNTVRSDHRVKGLTDSRGSFPLGLPCPPLLCFYYSTSLFSCQGVLENYFRFAWLGELLPLSAPRIGQKGLDSSPCHFTSAPTHSQATLVFLAPCTCIIAQVGLFVKGFFTFFFRASRVKIWEFLHPHYSYSYSLGWVILCPLSL